MKSSQAYQVEIRSARELIIWGVLALVVLVCVGWPTSSYAQQLDPESEQMLSKVHAADKSFDTSPVPASSVDPVNLGVHWRLWKRVFATGEPGLEELDALASDGFSVGYRNLPEYATAVYSMTEGKVASGKLSVHDASSVYERAIKLAPDLPYPDLAYSAHLARHNTGRLPAIVGSYVRGLRKGFNWLDSRVSWELKLTVVALISFLVAVLFFLLAQLVRYFGIIAYDAARLLPRGFSSNQTVILVVALIVVPGLLLRSPLVSMLILLALISLVQRVNERVVTVAIFGVLMCLPWLDANMAKEVTWPASDAQTLMHDQYLYCGKDCTAALQKRWRAHEGDDRLLTYSVALALYRLGGAKRLGNVVKMLGDPAKWPASMRPHVENLLGATLVAQAKPKEAIKHLEVAEKLAPADAAAPMNMMRAYQMNNDADAADAALKQAISVDLDAVRTHLDLERRDVNSFLLVEPLPGRLFWQRHLAHKPKEDLSVISPVWAALSGPRVPMERAPMLGGIGILLALLSLPLYLGGRASSPCPKCGMARDPADEPETGNHRYCLPCYHTFVSGASLDYNARVHNERVLGRRERFQDVMRRALSLVMPGTGHAQAGHGLGGFVVTFLTVFGLVVLLRPMGIWRPPFELFTDNWAAQKYIAVGLIGIGLIVGLAAVARGVSPTFVAHTKDKRGAHHE